MSVERELRTIRIITESSALGYYVKSKLNKIPFFSGYYDANLLDILECAINTKRYKFIEDLQTACCEHAKDLTQDGFANILLQTFIKHSVTSDHKDPGLKKIKVAINRYLDAHNLNYLISRHDLSKEFTWNEYNNLKKERISRRRFKDFFGYLAFALAFLVAFPEGALAVYGYGVFTLFNVAVFGLSAFCVSYFLYKNDIYSFIKNFFKSEKKAAKKPKINSFEEQVLNFITVFAGVAMGILLFNSIYVPAGMLIYGLGSAAAVMSASLPLLFIASVFFATVTALANIALFKPICYKTYLSFKKFFAESGWKKLGFSDLISLSLSAAAIIFAQLWFYNESFQLLTSLFGFGITTSQISAGIISVLGCLNGIFYGKNLYQFLGTIKNTIYRYFSGTADRTKAESSTDPLNLGSKRWYNNIINYTIIGVLVLFCIGNATGVATGVSALLTSVWVLKYLAFGLIYTASFTANSKASIDAFSPLPDASDYPASLRVVRVVRVAGVADSVAPGVDVAAAVKPMRTYHCYKFQQKPLPIPLESDAPLAQSNVCGEMISPLTIY